MGLVQYFFIKKKDKYELRIELKFSSILGSNSYNRYWNNKN